EYTHLEVGQPRKADGSLYRIGRPASEVFADAALASAAHRPITIGHPGEDVTAANWKRLAVGDIGDEIEQRGKFVRVPVTLSGAAVALAVGRVTAKLADAEGKVTSLTTDLGTANTTVQTRDGEIVALKQQLKDAEVTPAKLQDMADARAKVLTDAKAIAGDKLG